MKKQLIFFPLFGLLFFCLVFFTEKPDDQIIRLRFNLAYQEESISKQKTGLLWALSFLGAELPIQSFDKSFVFVKKNTYALNISTLGFNNNAVGAFKKIISELKQSEEYHLTGGIDLGEFIVYTLGSSWHYYAITGAAPTFADFKNLHPSDKLDVFPLLHSDIASHHRIIKIGNDQDILKTFFIAEGGNGDLDKSTFETKTYEVFDIMKNGQLRFAIYGADGELKAASEKELSKAGKPTKCLWCHETSIQPLFTTGDSLVGFLSPTQFQNLISNKMDLLRQYRDKLKTEIIYSHTQDHALTELLYINYMEPSIKKLSAEWRQNENTLLKKFKNQPKHDHNEYGFLKNLLTRAQIKMSSPYKTVALPDSIWEENASEPNIFMHAH